ncbi:hypothetical protein F0L74_24715 [Chitinophaga agrisoli]|uniref:ABC-2 family transporter n=1 Tax=Chitinophaga agrisoli TaxID=2607653 RepID=A0A5B2VL17_9BACT|nr:ABC transporter permease [Chitinophaga agrisoli]KAA2239408.1 hypothetical protein F0L74_24715 [Chitinophaga agrisoli]
MPDRSTAFIKAETLKLRRVHSLHLLYIFPVLLAIIAMFVFMKESAGMDPEVNPRLTFLYRLYFGFYTYFSPLTMGLLVFSMLQMEHKGKTWESVLLLPIPRYQLYLGKLMVTSTCVLFYVTVSWLSYRLAIQVLAGMYPQLPFADYSDGIETGLFFLRFGLVLWMLAVIFFNVYLYLPNALFALGGAFFVLTGSFLLVKQHWAIYFPFAYPSIVSKTYGITRFWDKPVVLTLVWLLVAGTGGMLFFAKSGKAVHRLTN